MIKKMQYYFFLFVLLCTSGFFTAHSLESSLAEDALSSKIIITGNAIVYSNDTGLSSHLEKSQKNAVIFVQNGAILYTDKNISSEIVYQKQIKSEKRLAKKTEPKKTVPALQKKENKIKTTESNNPEIFFTDAHSDKHILSRSGSNFVFVLPVYNTISIKQVAFHYTQLNIPTYLYLEKIYSEEFSLSSEHSKSYFSRPPPSFI